MEWKESEHPRDSEGKFTYTDGVNARVKWAKDHNIDLPLRSDGSLDDDQLQNEMSKSGARIFGAISGAIDPESPRGEAHAERYYEELRHRKDDVPSIARNTGFSESEILSIKNYLFVDKHDLSGSYERFAPSCYIAQSWQRLIEGKAVSADIVLLNHELMELKLVNEGYTQAEAHNLANKEYNCANAIKEMQKEKKSGKT